MRWSVFRILPLAAVSLIAAGSGLRIGEAEGKKAAIDKPAPVYPMAARQLKITGRVVVEAAVGESGVVEGVGVVSGNPVLTKAAADAVKKWRFHPFEDQGKPARAVVTLSFEFDTN